MPQTQTLPGREISQEIVLDDMYRGLSQYKNVINSRNAKRMPCKRKKDVEQMPANVFMRAVDTWRNEVSTNHPNQSGATQDLLSQTIYEKRSDHNQ